MLHHRSLIAAVATAAALAATAPAAPAMPIDGGGASSTVPEPERVRVVRVQVDEGLDWADAGIGAAGTLALVLAGYGALTTVPRRQRSAVHS